MRSVLRIVATCGALAVLDVFVACAASEDGVRPADNREAGTLPPTDGSASDAGDGATEAAAPRECSNDGFCHTVLPKNQTLRGVWGDGQGVVWAVSDQGAILRWDGAQWTPHASGLGPLTAVWGSGPTDVWVGGEGGIFHGTGASPSALTFVPTTTPTGTVSAIGGTGATDLWAVLALPDDAETRSRVLHSTGGDTWTIDPISSEPIKFLHVFGSAETGVWLAGTEFYPETFLESGRMFRREPGSSDFVALPLPGDPDDPSEFGEFGELFSASVVGSSEVLLQARATGGSALFVRGTSTNGGHDFTWTSERDGTYEDPATNAVSALSATDAWAVGEYGRIRHWDGVEWAWAAITVTDYPVIAPFYGVWAKGPNDIWVVGEDIALHLDPAKRP